MNCRALLVRGGVVGLSMLVMSSATPTLVAQSNQPSARYAALAVNLSGVGPSGATPVQIVVNRWSSDAERDRLKQTFLAKGPEKLLDALQDTRPVGYIRTNTSLGWDLRFATRVPDDEGGARIFILTDRPIGFVEARNRPRSIDYPFTLIEMRVDKNGQGEGRASFATKITWNKKTNMVELEDFGTQPVMLNNVRVES